jgi:hypothetical protein
LTSSPAREKLGSMSRALSGSKILGATAMCAVTAEILV